MKANLIKTDGSEVLLDLTADDQERYQIIADAIQGAVAQYVLKNKKIMYYNEDGKMLGLNVNYTATKLALGIINPNEYIVGNVVVVDPNIK